MYACAYSRSWHKHDAKQRRQPPFASSNGILVDVFSAILSRAALRNTRARRGATPHECTRFSYARRIPSRSSYSLFFTSSRFLRAPAAWTLGLGSSSFGESASILPVSAYARYDQSPGCLSPCAARHPVEWTIQFLGTMFVCTTYPPLCRPIST